MSQESSAKVEVLLLFPKHSTFGPAKEGEFIYTPEYGENYVYEGRALSVEEFNEIPSFIFEEGRYSQMPRLQIIVQEPKVKKVAARKAVAKKATRKRVTKRKTLTEEERQEFNELASSQFR